MNAACLNNNVECLALLIQHGGSLGKVSTLHKESAIVTAHKTGNNTLAKFIQLLRNEALTDDGRNLLESASNNIVKVKSYFILCNKYHTPMKLRSHCSFRKRELSLVILPN